MSRQSLAEQVTILIYTFPKPGSEEVAFVKIVSSIERTWGLIGRLKTVIVTSHRFPAVDRFAAEHPSVELQVESRLVPGKLRTMSLDCVERLYTRFTTPFVLVIQDDGYPLRDNLCDFLGKYDFIGAPSVRDKNRRFMNALGLPCLNGGFSLRSARICRAAARNWKWFWRFLIPLDSRFFAEDTFYTMTACLNPFYRWRHRFANESEAFSFSFDHLDGLIAPPCGLNPFGFHGHSTQRLLRLEGPRR